MIAALAALLDFLLVGFVESTGVGLVLRFLNQVRADLQQLVPIEPSVVTGARSS